MPGTPLFMQAAAGDTPPSFSAMDYRRLIQAVSPTERLVTPASFRVHQRAAGANFQVEVDPGQAVVTGDDVANQGNYLCTSTAVDTITIPAAPATGTRTHRIVLQVRDRLHGAYPDYAWESVLIADTGAGVPAVPASAMPLARVAVAAGQGTVADANITDDRVSPGVLLVTDPAQVTAGAGWTVTAFRGSRVFLGPGVGAAQVTVQASFTRATGAATLTGDATGNLSPDTDLGTVPVPFRPTVELSGLVLQNVTGGPATGRLNLDGVVTIQELSASATLPAGRVVRLWASYLQTGVTA